jgi:hypothetical protein
MHTVELLDEVMHVAREAGYQVRQEWLGGNRGGACEIKGQKWIFVDLADTPWEQLQQICRVLAVSDAGKMPTASPRLQSMLKLAA